MQTIELRISQEVRYRVGQNGLGGHHVGDIIAAFLILGETDSELSFIYHPMDVKNKVCPCLDLCKFNYELGVYEPIRDENGIESYLNLPYLN